MRPLAYFFVVILTIGWVIGFFALHLGSVIHVLLIAAVVVLVLRMFGERKVLE